ncbi:MULTISPECIES: alpha/beta fold hydrolase [Mycobacteriaceae]|uniref:Alpha/beta hydrolase n=1 Tax=Mycolicibacterium neoaurum VKM Ac-1815D TaxID=700508 RepID=V5XI47_MYCNE|nr:MULTISPECIES: alpha/beta hydrolase [Mycobacteriaceae]AHC27667.1 alpha/beta hydrolase [Mycolicibacterium neoaurum VKM Ac-1815D]AMO08673.1 alpha/beta hydrolase [Mycolicibacterium neoaurum]AXK78753.1 alpha/beta hydrolase [Mycolicibacterium neoaurum]KJQ49774.1 alpha/beta hydrolase [Mycolicibacterium neoaurum]KUM07259.1 alpha/beta hydrolase [Mycolicibacterium neoaurum]
MARPDPSVVRIDGPWRHFQVHANGIRFHVVEAEESPETEGRGRADRPLVILLHGFGSFWWSWRHQLHGRSDHRVVAVDLRGYGDSDKPPRGYDGWTLAGDTAGLVRALGHNSATLVGHADGGLVCWATAQLHPRMVDAVALISSPHPVALRSSVVADSAQRRALLPWLLRYQLPRWPEHKLTRHNAAELERIVRDRAGHGWVATEDFAVTMRHLRQAIQIPGAVHSTLEYQRWAMRSQIRGEGRRFMRSMAQPIDIPLLHLRGAADPYVLADPVRRSRPYAPDGRFEHVDGAGHFAHEENPRVVNTALAEFLGAVYPA